MESELNALLRLRSGDWWSWTRRASCSWWRMLLVALLTACMRLWRRTNAQAGERRVGE